jgi:putative hemolysin
VNVGTLVIPDPLLVTFTLLVGASFLVSGAETALFSFDAAERQRLTTDSNGQRLLHRLERLEVRGTTTDPAEITLLLLDVSATVAAAAVGVHLVEIPLAALVAAVGLPASVVPWLAIGVLTPILVMGPKVTARSLAFRFRHIVARLAIGPVTALHLILTPVRLLVGSATDNLARLIGGPPDDTDGEREAEIMDLIEQGTESGTVHERERDIVEAVFDFGEITVGRLMTPRTDMFAVGTDLPWPDLLAKCREAGYSRVPVYARRTDDIVGVLLLKDLLRHRAVDAGPPGWTQLRSLLLPPTFVPQSKPADAMMREFLAQKKHIAFVVDEHGTLVGLITLDDLLKRLVGEFLPHDEESDESSISTTMEGLIRVKAWMDVDDFIDETGIEIPRDGYHTVGGFVFHQLGRLPHKGDIVTHGMHRFVVAAMEGRRIAEIVVQILPEATPSPEPPVEGAS